MKKLNGERKINNAKKNWERKTAENTKLKMIKKGMRKGRMGNEIKRR